MFQKYIDTLYYYYYCYCTERLNETEKHFQEAEAISGKIDQ